MLYQIQIPEANNSGQNRQLFVLCDLEIWQMTLRKKGHLFYAAWSFVHNLVAICEFKLELQSRNAQFGSKSAIFLSRVTLKFDGWPWKTIGHLHYVTLSFVHHFIAICWFKLELHSGNTQFGSKSAVFLSCVTLKFDGWPWKTIGHPFLTLTLIFCMDITSVIGNNSWKFDDDTIMGT